MKSKDTVLFYAKYTDEHGVTHHAIHKYHSVSGIVDMMRDFKDDKFIYPICDVETYKYENEHKNYKRYVLARKVNQSEIKVYDTQEDRFIAKFYDNKLAEDYCDLMNLNDKYADNLEDDPWL